MITETAFELKTRADFGKMVEMYRKNGLGAEIGVQFGVFSAKIAENYKGKLLCIDLWGDEDIYYAAKHLLADPDKYKMLRGDSLTMAEFVTDGSLDFVYIDANHHYDEVRADIDAWLPKVRPGGIIAGHDYCAYDDIEVIQAVDDWAQGAGYEINVTPHHEADCWNGILFPTWWTIKKDEATIFFRKS